MKTLQQRSTKISETAESCAIHPTAIIDSRARLGTGNRIGPYAVIGPDAVIGSDNDIGPHAVLAGNTTLGDSNKIFQFASIGAPPQDLKWRGEESRLVIGSRNIIREYVTLQPGTAGGGGVTVIGDDNLFMAVSHVAHDCRIGSHVHLANAATLAGHVEVGDHAALSGLCAVHQYARIGAYAFVSGGAMVSQDVPPFCLVQGDRARLIGLNEVGLKRGGFAQSDILALRRALRGLFRSDGTKAERMAAVEAQVGGNAAVRILLDFVATSTRGVVRQYSRNRSAGLMSAV